MGTLKAPLPACFRLNTGYAFVDKLRSELMEFVGSKIVTEDYEIDAVSSLEWCPNAYKLGIDRRAIRKSTNDKISQLHEWMKKHTENGDITRQEAVIFLMYFILLLDFTLLIHLVNPQVSMVPPLALNVEPHHKCLDMCAAPGSKTSQLLEIINRSLFTVQP